MQKRIGLFLCFSLIFLGASKTFATHIVGGELNYKYLGLNKYEIRVTIYRDACVGQVGFDDPASLGVFNSSNNLLFQKLMTPIDSGTVPPILYDPCTDVPVFFCYKYCHYTDTINLPPLAGGYQLVYQRCCRNQNIINLINPQNVGATYTAFVPGPEVVAVNSNPVFKNIIPPFVCANKPFTFDNSAIDSDGDSLVYEIYTPFDGATASNPMPQPPNNPPYVNVPWQSPYSTSNMLGGTPLTINSVTGLVSATPNTLGYFVVGLKVKEYRNGILLSETRRDYQIIVKSCPTAVVAAAQAPQAICETTNISFSNSSTGNNLGFNWYFGDPTTLADTSHLTTPTYNYPSTGTYSVILVAYVSTKPLCNDTVFTTVSISSSFKAIISYTPITCSENGVEFSGFVESPPGTTPVWHWNFGDGDSSKVQNPTHNYPNTGGNYQITLITYIPNSINCMDTVTVQNININTNSELFIPNTFTPNGDGHNDLFKVRGPQFGVYYFAVYTRWGELVFETTDPTQGWDGSFKGKPADPGVFGYYVKAKCSNQSPEIFKKGNVTLIR